MTPGPGPTGRPPRRTPDRSRFRTLLSVGLMAAGLAAVGLPAACSVPVPAAAPSIDSRSEGRASLDGRASPDPGDSVRLRIHFLDVGQGDATLIEVPGGGLVLVDAGRDGRVVDHLHRLEVDTIDLFVASHNHADHIGGAAAVVRAFPVRFFMDNGVPHTTLTYERMLDALLAHDVPLLEPERRTITLGPASIEVLPPPGDASLGHNDNSVGLILEFGEFRASFAGDAEARLWRHWLDADPAMLPEVGVHKASHHGSRNGDIGKALERLAPDLVVVSAGRDNAYGHPHVEALERYRAVGASVLQTAEHGTLTVVAGRDGSFEVFVAEGSAFTPLSPRRIRGGRP